MGRLFGTDGIRGIAGEDLSAKRALAVGEAIGRVLSEDYRHKVKIALATDTRISSGMLEAAMLAGLRSSGADTVSLGVAPTPAVAFLTVKNGLDAGVVISASHNPYEYNGIKIFGKDGFKIPDEIEKSIEDLVLESSENYRRRDGNFGNEIEVKYRTEDYQNHITENGCNLKGMRIGIDCANGATAETAQKIFPALGAECHFIGCSPNGKNINEKCGSTSTESLKNLVKEKRLHLGIAFDGDGDRCLAVDEKGNEVDGDYIMAILAKSLKMKSKLYKNGVVGTVMTNLGFIKFCESERINYYSSKVGDRYVLELMEQESLSFGGEQSGHIILRELATTGDGQLTAAVLLSVIKESGKSLSSLSSVMKKYPQYQLSVKASEKDKIALKIDPIICEHISETEKLLSDGRLVVRPSGTEPLIRIMAEGEREEFIKKAVEDLAQKINSRLEELK